MEEDERPFYGDRFDSDLNTKHDSRRVTENCIESCRNRGGKRGMSERIPDPMEKGRLPDQHQGEGASGGQNPTAGRIK